MLKCNRYYILEVIFLEQLWLTINFTLPKEPSRARVSVWRKLKRTGAVNIGQSIWVLPYTEEHMAVFRDIVDEVKKNNGLAFVMKADFLQEKEDKPVTEYFNITRDEEYKEFLEKCSDFHKEIQKEIERDNYSFAEIEENEHELAKLTDWLNGIFKRDFFKASLCEESQNELLKCKEELEQYCNRVYEKNDAL